VSQLDCLLRDGTPCDEEGLSDSSLMHHSVEKGARKKDYQSIMPLSSVAF